MSIKTISLSGGGQIRVPEPLTPDELIALGGTLDAPKMRYNHLEWITAIGDAVAIEILESADPVVKLIDRKFQLLDVVNTGDPATRQALDYLAASTAVPGFTEALRDTLCGITS